MMTRACSGSFTVGSRGRTRPFSTTPAMATGLGPARPGCASTRRRPRCVGRQLRGRQRRLGGDLVVRGLRRGSALVRFGSGNRRILSLPCVAARTAYRGAVFKRTKTNVVSRPPPARIFDCPDPPSAWYEWLRPERGLRPSGRAPPPTGPRPCNAAVDDVETFGAGGAKENRRSPSASGKHFPGGRTPWRNGASPVNDAPERTCGALNRRQLGVKRRRNGSVVSRPSHCVFTPRRIHSLQAPSPLSFISRLSRSAFRRPSAKG